MKIDGLNHNFNTMTKDLTDNVLLLGGVEEAGRGPVIGPMVMACVTVKSGVQEKLKQIGVKDSKLLTPKKREELFDKIIELVYSYEIIVLSAKEVDNSLFDETMNLNKLEAKTSANLINKLKPNKVILDCPSTNPLAYKEYVKSFILDKNIEVIAEHKADVNYPVVSAASILAKVTRDKKVQELQVIAEKKLNLKLDIGSGYPSDPYTKIFLEKYWDKLDDVKDGFFRKSWKTYQNVAKSKSQKSLANF